MGGVEDAYRRGLCVYGCIEILQEAEGRKRQKRWLILLPMATVVAHHQEQSGRQIEPIVRNDTLHTPRGHIEKFSLPAASELGLPTTVCTVTT